jgi:hypothetical protein
MVFFQFCNADIDHVLNLLYNEEQVIFNDSIIILFV